MFSAFAEKLAYNSCMASQFPTAVFEMRPTRRKASAFERVRTKAERVFWSHLASVRVEAEQIVD